MSTSSRSRRHAANPTVAAAARRWTWRAPVGAILLTLVVLITGIMAVAPIGEAASGDGVMGAALHFPLLYDLLAPASTSLDALTLLGVGQHIAIGVWVLLGYPMLRALYLWWRPASSRGWRREGLWSIGAFVALLVVYAIGVFVPRPMAAINPSASDLLAVDFHAHTHYSHDGKAWRSLDRVRDWYGGAGFDVVYVTDHRTYEGAERLVAGNPRMAGEGLMFLQGLEAVWRGEHVNILGAGRRYRGITTDDLRDVEDDAVALASLIPWAEPVIIETLPGNLSQMVPASGPGTAGVRAIEIIDGAPRGLTQTRRERPRIVQLADSLDIALVAGSNNHGHGFAAAGWTLMQIPAWRTLPTDSLSLAIETYLRRGGRGSTMVVERRVAMGTDPLRIALAPFHVAWRMFTTLTVEQRIAWIVWIWVVVGMRHLMRRRRRARDVVAAA